MWDCFSEIQTDVLTDPAVVVVVGLFEKFVQS